MKRITLIGGAVVACVACVFRPSAAAAGVARAEYQTAAVTRGAITQAVTATGTLNPVVNVQVGSQISGNIQKLFVDFNSPVKAGQVVAQIDPAVFQASVYAGRRRPGQCSAPPSSWRKSRPKRTRGTGREAKFRAIRSRPGHRRAPSGGSEGEDQGRRPAKGKSRSRSLHDHFADRRHRHFAQRRCRTNRRGQLERAGHFYDRE